MPSPVGRRFSALFGPDGRLRTTLRLGLYLALMTFVLLLLQVAALSALRSLAGSAASPPPDPGRLGLSHMLALELAGLIGMTAVTLVARRWLDRRSVASLGLQARDGWLTPALFGLALGAGLISLVFLLEWATGSITWTLAPGAPPLWDLAGSATLFAMVAWTEELAMRGYVLQNAAEAWGRLPGALVSALVFSLLHLSNPGADLLAALGLFTAGLLFAVAFFVSGSLWLPLALHFSWNFFEGPVFGFPVSGIVFDRLLVTTPVGPDIITGGGFGPEAGLSGILAACVGIAVCYAYGRWRQTSLRKAR